jgi:outer membrane beta-barrel protein
MRPPASILAIASALPLGLVLPSVSWAQVVITSDPEADPPEKGEAATDDPSAEDAPADPGTRVACIDDTSEDGYQRKGVQKRDFLKRGRVELGAVGGFYASDVLSSTYAYGGSLAYFPSEDFGFELLVTRSPVQFRLEEPFSAFDQRQRFQAGAAFQALGALLFSPVHAKFKFSETTIVHGDLFVLAGAGRTMHSSVQGITWQAGFGMKLYLSKYVAFRLDVRDFVLPQEVLGRGRITNNVSILAGFSAWFG